MTSSPSSPLKGRRPVSSWYAITPTDLYTINDHEVMVSTSLGRGSKSIFFNIRGDKVQEPFKRYVILFDNPSSATIWINCLRNWATAGAYLRCGIHASTSVGWVRLGVASNHFDSDMYFNCVFARNVMNIICNVRKILLRRTSKWPYPPYFRKSLEQLRILI